MKITFNEPITLGSDLARRHTVVEMEVITIAFNLAPTSSAGNIQVSVTLRDPASGFQQHWAYEDATVTPLFWQQIEGLQLHNQKWMTPLLNRLIEDGVLPAGKID